MCGITGYVGKKEAAPILLAGLKRLEYRGYDSAGVAVLGTVINVKKDAGKIDEIHSKLNFLDLPGQTGIAHTRWATHGGVTQANAHPHLSCDGEIAVVHNGIIENYQELREFLIKRGHVFRSQTDTEVIPHLIEDFYLKKGDTLKAVLEGTALLKGSFAFLVIFKAHPNLVIGARKDAPLIVGVKEREYFVASDALAFIEYTDRVMFLDNYEVVVADREEGVKVFGFDGKEVKKEITQVAWEASDITRKEFAHFTIKEIHEQGEILRNVLYQDMDKVRMFIEALKTSSKVFVVACGTSYHAGLVARYLFAKTVKKYIEVMIASEFGSFSNWVDDETTILAISQSGETADVLHAIREARAKGAKILSIVNVVGSSLARESDLSLCINCGPEIGVAATKSFTAQLTMLYFLAFIMANMEVEAEKLPGLNEVVRKVLKQEDKIVALAEKYANRNDYYFIGRALHYPIALEGALKLKELAYIHAEGMPAGELKHGTLALVDHGTPTIVINPEDETYNETLSNAMEMKSRGAKIIGISTKKNEIYDEFIEIPEVDPNLYAIIEVIPLQMLAYYVAIKKEINPDFPRNLAKSVTVK